MWTESVQSWKNDFLRFFKNSILILLDSKKLKQNPNKSSPRLTSFKHSDISAYLILQRGQDIRVRPFSRKSHHSLSWIVSVQKRITKDALWFSNFLTSISWIPIFPIPRMTSLASNTDKNGIGLCVSSSINSRCTSLSYFAVISMSHTSQ